MEQEHGVNFLSEIMGISALPREEQERITNLVSGTFFQKIFVALYDMLNDEEREKFSDLLERGASFEEIDGAFSEKFSQYPKVFQSLVDEFGRDIAKARETADIEYQTYANSLQS